MEVLDDIRIEKYPAYKDSGVDWLEKIPNHWELLPGLSFIFENKDERDFRAPHAIFRRSPFFYLVKLAAP